jgi:hypothetical protein
MTRKNVRKQAARARQAQHGGKYQAHFNLLSVAAPAAPRVHIVDAAELAWAMKVRSSGLANVERIVLARIGARDGGAS